MLLIPGAHRAFRLLVLTSRWHMRRRLAHGLYASGAFSIFVYCYFYLIVGHIGSGFFHVACGILFLLTLMFALSLRTAATRV
jgi:hypothetical protein